MDISSARKVGAELASRLPWQEVADSPTIRFYTDWARFDGFRPAGMKAVARGADQCEVILVNGQLAGAGQCAGVEVVYDSEVFWKISMNSKILALHAAALSHAVAIKVARTVDKPLIIRALGEAEAGSHVATHISLIVKEGASATITTVVDSSPGVMHTAVIEGSLKGDVEFLLISNGSGPQYVHSALDVASSVRSRPLVVGSSMNAVREEYYVGERAFAEVVGLELGIGESRIDHVVSVVNVGKEGRGYAKLLGVAKDKSFVTQRAVGRITKTGVWSDNAVEGVIYIAGEGAVANTQPVILVETGEVSGARHSAADASLDEEREFLLRARGVPRAEIPALIVASLVDQYLSSLSESARGIVEEILRKAV